MPDLNAHRILLLPKDDYWAWVGVCKDYAVRFGVTVTPTPQNAARFHRPKQVISVVALRGGYPGYGDIVGWLRSEVPDVRLDVLNVDTPVELQYVLNERILRGDVWLMTGTPIGEKAPISVKPEPNRSAQSHVNAVIVPESPAPVVQELRPQPSIQLVWPTDYLEVVQGFGENPSVYRRFGLPGHDGIDIKAPLNSRVYACADGQVYQVHDGSGGHPYGIHIRIRHIDGYSTVYAHLNQATVYRGQDVRAGDLIGLADSTGNSTGSQLHLTLKKEGATAAGLTRFPNDIIDPSPYLVLPPEARSTTVFAPVWPPNRCLIGLHSRIGGPTQPDDWQLIAHAGIEALMIEGYGHVDAARAREVNPDLLIVARLTVDFSSTPVTPARFVEGVEENMARLYELGVSYYEVHTTPNLVSEGYGISWQSGAEFGDWFLAVKGALKPKFPEAQLGWPALSPGRTEGIRFDHLGFLESARTMVGQADWIACNCFWQYADDMMSRDGGLGFKVYRDEWPDKLLFITEFGNTQLATEAQVRANQYLQYYNYLRHLPGIGAAFSFPVSAPSSLPYETWRSQDGTPAPIANLVAARGF